MRIIRDLSLCPSQHKGTAVALGNFDGVHLGHLAILKETIAIARANNCPSAVMTFEPHPREFFSKNPDGLRIYSLRQKLKILENSGIDMVFLMRFNKSFAATSAQNFIDDVLHEKLRVRHVITGQNFFFGQNRQGNRELLAKEASRLEFGFTAHPPVYAQDKQLISSSAIREKLSRGDMAGVAAQLGRRYCIDGRVIRGQHRGLGFPTANLSLKKLFKPRFGIYAVRVRIEDEDVWHAGAANLGISPTFNNPEALLEVHIFAMDRDLYGKRLEIECIEFMRDEQKFSDIEALKTQIAVDCERAKNILKENP